MDGTLESRIFAMFLGIMLDAVVISIFMSHGNVVNRA
jgi:hypothetical protein